MPYARTHQSKFNWCECSSDSVNKRRHTTQYNKTQIYIYIYRCAIWNLKIKLARFSNVARTGTTHRSFFLSSSYSYGSTFSLLFFIYTTTHSYNFCYCYFSLVFFFFFSRICLDLNKKLFEKLKFNKFQIEFMGYVWLIWSVVYCQREYVNTRKYTKMKKKKKHQHQQQQ